MTRETIRGETVHDHVPSIYNVFIRKSTVPVCYFARSIEIPKISSREMIFVLAREKNTSS